MTRPPFEEQPAPSSPAVPNQDQYDILPIFDRVPTGLLVLDAEGIVLRINRVAEARIGEPAPDLIGRDLFREVFPPLEAAGLGAQYREEFGGGEMAIDGDVALAGGERHLWLGIRSFRFRGIPWGVALIEDRSTLAREEERRKRAERLAAVGELAAGVAHEVNNPLASIKSFAQLLARDQVTEEQSRALAIIIQESNRISQIVDSLVSFARQQGVSGREPVNLNSVAEEVLSMQRYAIETAGINVRRDFDLALSPVMGEAGALQQVILNLVVNAEEALVNKPGERLLIVRTRESSEGVVLSVVDNGPGIPRELLPHIFESLHSSKPDGSGLSLGISATIVREHSGQILAESEEGRGAAFYVRLPRATAPVEQQRAPRRAAPRAVPTRPLRILVADDEPTLRLAVALFLSRRGHEVVEAADAHEAFRLAGESEFDVALVDARMPGDGLALLEKLEAMPTLRGRTALMTGDLGRARTTHGITTGRPYLTKPFDMGELVRLIEKLGQ